VRNKFVDRYRELYENLGIKFIVYKGIIWKEYQKMIIPIGPIKIDYSISEEDYKYLLSQFPKSLLVRTTSNFTLDEKNKTEWYAVIADKFYDLEYLSSNTRSKIRRGLKKCRVEKIDVEYLANNGYEVFINAFKKYKGVKIPNITKEQFKNKKLLLKDFEDIAHFWGVFYQDKLVAYSENYIYDNIEVSYSTIKFHPDYLKFYASYILIYTMNKYYLENNLVEYVNDGFRSILHQTNIQKFLIEKFNFKKAYVNLDIHYNQYLKLLINGAYPFKSLVSKINPKIEALLKLEEIRRSYIN
jgi:hypothetical protein